MDWALLADIRIALSELKGCQSQVLQEKMVCFASLIDARERLDMAIEIVKKEMERAANEPDQKI